MKMIADNNIDVYVCKVNLTFEVKTSHIEVDELIDQKFIKEEW